MVGHSIFVFLLTVRLQLHQCLIFPISDVQILGDMLFPLVEQLVNEKAYKVTGMLLELDKTEVLNLVESPDTLRDKVAEAMKVLELEATATAAAAASGSGDGDAAAPSSSSAA